MTKKLKPESILTFIQQFLPENPIIIEAGAHIGRDTLKISIQWPQAIIYAFEPVDYLYKSLQKNTAHLSAVQTFNLALSDTEGTKIMHVSPELGAVSSLLKPTVLQQEKPNISFYQQPIETITLNTWAQQNNVAKADFLWLDLQGHELATLKGASSLLLSVRVIYVEVNLKERYQNQPLYQELRFWLEEKNFYVAKEYLHHGTWGNVLFVQNKTESQNFT